VSWNCGYLFSRVQTGSAFILIGSFFATVPSTVTLPLTSPAVAVSTFCPAGVPAGPPGSADVLDVSLLPPHAMSDPASASPSALAHTFRRRIDLSFSTMPVNYHNLPTWGSAPHPGSVARGAPMPRSAPSQARRCAPYCGGLRPAPRAHLAAG